MNEIQCYPRNPQVFLADTLGCSIQTEVAHNRLTDTYYATGRPIKDDKTRICLIGKIHDCDYVRVRGELMELGWRFENGEMRHKRIEATLAEMEESRQAILRASQAGVEKRRQIGQLPPIEPQDQPPVKRMVRPSIEDVKLFCAKSGIPESDSDWFFYKCEGNGWTNGGKPILRWTQTLLSWKAASFLPSQRQDALRVNGATARAIPTEGLIMQELRKTKLEAERL